MGDGTGGDRGPDPPQGGPRRGGHGVLPGRVPVLFHGKASAGHNTFEFPAASGWMWMLKRSWASAMAEAQLRTFRLPGRSYLAAAAASLAPSDLANLRR